MAIKAYTDIGLRLKSEIPETEPVIFNAGSIHGGITNNVVCEECELFCTVRTHSDEVCDTVVGIIKQTVSDTARDFGGHGEYIQTKYYPVLYNDKRVTEKGKAILSAALGADRVLKNSRDMIGEDFSYFARLKPSLMIRLGVRNEEKGITAPLHSQSFRIDESALQIGSNFYFNYIMSLK